MIGKNKTEQFGHNGLELNFYTGEDIGKDIRLFLPDENKSGYGNAQLFAAKIYNPADFNGVMNLLYFINETIDSIYSCHNWQKQNGHFDNIHAAKYYIGIHSFIDNTAKFFSYMVMSQCMLTGRKMNNTSILNVLELFNKKEEGDTFAVSVWDDLFRGNVMHSELVKIVEWIHQIFYSINMFTNTRIFSPDLAAVCALEPSQNADFSYMYHNHTLRQLVFGLDDFLHSYFEITQDK